MFSNLSQLFCSLIFFRDCFLFAFLRLIILTYFSGDEIFSAIALCMQNNAHNYSVCYTELLKCVK